MIAGGAGASCGGHAPGLARRRATARNRCPRACGAGPATLSTANMSLPSFEDMPSVPRATLTPCRPEAALDISPLPSFMLEIGLWTTVRARARAGSRCRDVGQPDPVREADAWSEEAERLEVLGQCGAIHLLPASACISRLEHVDVNLEVELVGQRRARPAGARRCSAADRTGRGRSRCPRRGGGSVRRHPARTFPLLPCWGVSVELEPVDQRRRRRAARRARRSRNRRGRPSRARSGPAGRDRGTPATAVERLVAEAAVVVEEVDRAGRARMDHLDPAEQRSEVDLARALRPVPPAPDRRTASTARAAGCPTAPGTSSRWNGNGR